MEVISLSVLIIGEREESGAPPAAHCSLPCNHGSGVGGGEGWGISVLIKRNTETEWSVNLSLLCSGEGEAGFLGGLTP